MSDRDPSWVLNRLQDDDSFDFVFYCPGCEMDHGFNAFKNQEPRWTFNGDMLKPTISPSLLIRYGKNKICHSFINNGMIEFLNDCTHALKGQTIPLEPYAD